ncbi:hypothetical protein M514_23667 [Trichuris suis]|uniref:Uncharacterized protein n=1 Tax=Trichuris suis TaxID=68888 RepID=A0A085N3Y2_9BILA|nr:hypothetical protein M514_23667 [Trichuris suis]
MKVEMKLTGAATMLFVFCLVLSLVLSPFIQGKQVADPRGEKAMQKIMERFGNFLYPTNQNQNSSELETWDDAEKTTAATNVFYMLLGKLDQSQKFDFSELIAGSKCIAQSGEKHVIMHLKLLRHGKCHKVPFFHRCPSEQNVYCTWSGTLHESMLNKTDGYLCFESNEVSKEDEEELANLNPCAMWKYSEEGAYRLPIPASMLPWKKSFLLYQPPIAFLRDEKGPDGGKGLPAAPKNPEGRTGIAGRGLLMRWGENKMEIPIIIRRFRGINLIIISSYCMLALLREASRKSAEVLMRGRYDKEKGESPLPMFYKIQKQEEDFPGLLSMEKHFYEMMATDQKSNCTMEKLRSSFKSARKLTIKYFPHPYATDNAWIAASIRVIGTCEEPCFNYLDLNKSSNQFQYRWEKYNDSDIYDMDDLVNSLLKKQLTPQTSAMSFVFSKVAQVAFLIAALLVSVLVVTICIALLLISIPVMMLLAAAIFETKLSRLVTMLFISCVVLSLLLSQFAQGKQVADPSQEERLDKLTKHFGNLLHPASRSHNRSELVNWKDGPKTIAATNVFDMLLGKLDQPQKFTFQKLIAGSKCRAPNGEKHVIMHLKLLRRGKCHKMTFLYDCPLEQNVYCTWSGTLSERMPKKTYGYFCFESNEVDREDEKELAELNPCGIWKYSDEGAYRLPVPAFMAPWDRHFLLYQPPIALLRDEKGPHGGKGLSAAPKNPEGRTGIAGRGLLMKWGENKMEIPIVIRKLEDGIEVLMRYQFDEEKGESVLPTFYKVSKEEKQEFPDVQTLEEHFHELVRSDLKPECSVKKLRSSMKLRRRLFSGYLDHPHTTDNAWVTANVYLVSTLQEPCFEYLELENYSERFQYKWKKFNKTEIHDIDDLVKSVFSKQVASEISVVNFAHSIIGFISFLFAAALIVIVFSTSTAAFVLFGLPAAILFLAFAVISYFSRKWMSVLSRVH